MTTERGGLDPTSGQGSSAADPLDTEVAPGGGAAPLTPRGSTSVGRAVGTSGGSADRLQDAAGGVASRVGDTAQEQVGRQVNSQLGHGADMLVDVSQAVRKSGDQLRGQQPQIASFADTAADRLDKAAQELRETDFQGLVRTAEDFARRQPAVFLGGALLLGVAASRFLKASPQRARSGDDRFRTLPSGDVRSANTTAANRGYAGTPGVHGSSTNGNAEGGAAYAPQGRATTYDQGAEHGGV
jgi:hypothetical protein